MKPRTLKREPETLSECWRREAQELGLKPWEYPPCVVHPTRNPYRPGEAQFATYARAQALRRELLARDPHHYDHLVPDPEAA